MVFPVDSPKKPDQFRALIEEIRKECWDNSGNLRDIVPILRTDLREAFIKAGRGRVDARIAARRITRALVVAARLQEDSARQALRSFQLFNEAVSNKSRPGAGPGFTL